MLVINRPVSWSAERQWGVKESIWWEWLRQKMSALQLIV